MNNAIDSFNKYLRGYIEASQGEVKTAFGNVTLITDESVQNVSFPLVAIDEIGNNGTNIKDLDSYSLQIASAMNNNDRNKAYNLALMLYKHFNLENYTGLNIPEYNYSIPEAPVLTGNTINITYAGGIKPVIDISPEIKKYIFEINLEYNTP